MKSTQLNLLIDKRIKRWFQILNSLERGSSLQKKLAQSLDISTKTILADIKEIEPYFNQSITIAASANGYTLTINDKVAYTDLKKKLLEHEPLLAILSGIFYGNLMSIFDWADQLFLADRTLIRYLKKLTPVLEHYQLKMTYPQLSLEGKEIDIRNFFLAIFYEEDTIPHYIFPPILINTIMADLSKVEFNHFQLDLPQYKMSYLLFITFQRISNGYTLEIDNVMIKPYLSNALKQLEFSFEKHTGFHLNSSDLVYLMLMMSNSNSYNSALELAPTCEEDIMSSSLQLTVSLCNELGILDDKQARKFIHSFFQLNYLKNAASVTCLFLPPSLIYYNNIHYKKELTLLKKFLKKYSDILLIDHSAEFEQTLLVFTIRLMYKLNQKSYNIAFIFEGSSEMTLLLEDITRTYMPSGHSIYFFRANTLLEEEFAKCSIDLVVTNFSEYIFELPEEMKYLLFSYHPTPDDWNELIKIIDPRLNTKYKISTALNTTE
ncbi:helix-turn-helix domain-containing protein [Enterococcus sp. 5H]|uniref:helix-turn-helix domain-containing protein n=1 Tax=Enterococcus sp. 5H TaxID=1229490 RepID=UPI002303DAC4|nr:helix-turn-helix domain-containing protein [Enterococcus sp. 5H]MDA9470668.1 hypothetical protein [Enterococcus sp. 5H]